MVKKEQTKQDIKETKETKETQKDKLTLIGTKDDLEQAKSLLLGHRINVNIE